MKRWFFLASILSALALAQNLQLLTQIDFSTKDGKMREVSQAEWEAAYVDGAMRMVIRQDQELAYTSPTFRAANVRVEVDATKINAPNNSAVGIFCRLNSDGSYMFGLNAERSIAIIWRNYKGESALLSRVNIPVHVPLYRENRYNRLTVECNGPTLSLAVNGHMIASVNDNSNLLSGSMGIWADRNDPGGNAMAFFDNFTVWSFDRL